MLGIIKDRGRHCHIQWLTYKSERLSALVAGHNVLIVAPHPDDEVIGCGGLIARLVREGRIPHVAVLTGGGGSHRGCCGVPEPEIVAARRKLTRRALGILGVDAEHLHEFEFRDGSINESDPEVDKLRGLIAELMPQSVFVPHWGEGWPDHVKAAEIVRTLVPKSTEVWEYCVWMWYYNVWRGLDWKNAAVLRMTPEEHRKKLEAMDAYTRSLAPCGKPWSGVLPPLFIKANSQNKELYFKVK